jgi:hypothetical protein
MGSLTILNDPTDRLCECVWGLQIDECVWNLRGAISSSGCSRRLKLRLPNERVNEWRALEVGLAAATDLSAVRYGSLGRVK